MFTFKDFSAIVEATEIPSYEKQNVYGVEMLLLTSDVNFILRMAKTLDAQKAAVYYNKAGQGHLINTSISEARYMHGIAGLLSEAEEIDEAVRSKDKHAVAVEIGDAMYFLDIIAKSNGLSLEQCAAAMAAKLTMRYPGKFTEEAARERNLLKEQMAYEDAVEMAAE